MVLVSRGGYGVVERGSTAVRVAGLPLGSLALGLGLLLAGRS